MLQVNYQRGWKTQDFVSTGGQVVASVGCRARHVRVTIIVYQLIAGLTNTRMIPMQGIMVVKWHGVCSCKVLFVNSTFLGWNREIIDLF